MSSPSLPRRLGRYELLSRIARGGMGTIYLARLSGDHRFEKRVAIKTLQEDASDDARFRSMFLDEVRIASRIDHPHVCSVIDAGSEDGELFMVMEYCDGLTLSQIRRRLPHRLPYEFYVRVVADAARGLHAAHELRDDAGRPLGVVHRDVSPQNIMVLRRGGVKVLDFGVARARDKMTKTQTGELKGKLAYMAPEQLRSDAVDRRADVWALGVVLWEMCFDYNPFDGGSPGVTVSNVTSRPLPDPHSLVGDCPERIADVLHRVLVRDPERRLPTAAALADELEACLYAGGEPFGMKQVAECVAPLWEASVAAPTEPTIEPDSVPADALHEQPTASLAHVADHRAHTRGQRGHTATLAAVLAVGVVVALAAAFVPWKGPGAQDAPTAPPARAERDDRPSEPPASSGSGPSEPVVDAVEAPAQARPPVAPRSRRDSAPRARPEAPVNRAPGFVSVFALPIADVWIDGRRVGETPLHRSIEPGPHRVVLRTQDGRSEAVTVRVVPGRTERVSIEFER